MPLITNQIHSNAFRKYFVANTVDQFPKAHHTHNHRNPNTWGIPQGCPTDVHKTKETTNLPNISSTPEQYLLNQDKSVDSWIDELDPCATSNLNTIAINQDITMTWLLQQNLPRMQIPLFNGSPLALVEFVTKFKDIVHDQSYLNNSQKFHYLQQHVTDEARRAIHGLSTDKRGYVLSLKRLKCSFGQRSRIAQAHLAKITRGKKIGKDDDKGLLEFNYTICDCLITLHQLNYESDVNSTDVLCQAIRRLPSKFNGRWGEHCMKLRSIREPTLIDLETWLNEKMQASTDPYLPPKWDNNSQRNLRQDENVRHTYTLQRLKENQTKLPRTNLLFVKEAVNFTSASHI